MEKTTHRAFPTSNTRSRPDIDLNRSFFGHLVAPLHLDRAIYGADDRVAIVCVCCGSVCAIQMRKSDIWGDHDWYVQQTITS